MEFVSSKQLFPGGSFLTYGRTLPTPTPILLNPLRPNRDLSQTSHCNIKGLSVSEVMRIENMVTQVKFS